MSKRDERQEYLLRFIRSREIFYKLINFYKNSRFYAFFVHCILEGYFMEGL